MRQLWTWIVAHPLLAWIGGGVVLSSLWYAVRRGAWPGVETVKLPGWARVVQALVEALCNLPGALAASGVGPALPPGTPAPAAPPAGRTTTVPPPPAALVLLALVGLGGVLAACGPVRTGATVLTPGAPLPDRCDAVGATRCDGLRVLTCSGTGREWEAMAGACAYGCEDTDAGARCTARDAGVEP